MSISFTSVTFDKVSYNVGDSIVMTANYTSDSATLNGADHTATLEFAAQGDQFPVQTTATFTVDDGTGTWVPNPITLTNAGANDVVFTLVSNTMLNFTSQGGVHLSTWKAIFSGTVAAPA